MTERREDAADKPGYKTTEFYLAVGMGLAHVAVSLGLLPQESDIEQVGSTIATMVAAAYVGGAYITSRTALKSGDRETLRDALRIVRQFAEERGKAE